jgi:hypothetical protein
MDRELAASFTRCLHYNLSRLELDKVVKLLAILKQLEPTVVNMGIEELHTFLKESKSCVKH